VPSVDSDTLAFILLLDHAFTGASEKLVFEFDGRLLGLLLGDHRAAVVADTTCLLMAYYSA
jgi:hypothetical protein